jgi:ribosomal protein S18 acetylase RimI-like enzyme
LDADHSSSGAKASAARIAKSGIRIDAVPEFHIRPATEADCAGILGCLHAAFEPYRSQYSAAAYEDTVLNDDSLRQRLGNMNLFVALDGSGNVIGTVGCSISSPGEGHIRGMAVLETWRGDGVADQLLDQAISKLREERCTRVTLDTTAPLKRAIRFYEKNGFRATGTVSDFFGMPLYEYARELNQHSEK